MEPVLDVRVYLNFLSPRTIFRVNNDQADIVKVCECLAFVGTNMLLFAGLLWAITSTFGSDRRLESRRISSVSRHLDDTTHINTPEFSSHLYCWTKSSFESSKKAGKNKLLLQKHGWILFLNASPSYSGKPITHKFLCLFTEDRI